MDSLASLAAIVLGLTFAIASANKLHDMHGFALGVLDYEVLPPRLGLIFARALPFAELLVGITLLAGLSPLGGGLASGLRACGEPPSFGRTLLLRQPVLQQLNAIALALTGAFLLGTAFLGAAGA